MTELGWERLQTRRRIHRPTLYHKLNTEQHLPNYTTAVMPRTRVQDTHRHLRNACEYTTSTTRTTSYKNSFFLTTTREWNQLPQATQNLAHSAFKKQLCRQLGESNPPLHFNIGSKRGNILHARLRMNMTHLKRDLLRKIVNMHFISELFIRRAFCSRLAHLFATNLVREI